MVCCKKKHEQTVDVTLIFKREELLYEVENYSFVEGDIMDDDIHAQHQVFDIAQCGNEDLVTRMFNLAHAECVEYLYPYTKVPCVHEEALDDTLIVHESYSIELKLPKTFSRTTVLLLRELIHKYFVCRVLVEWMSITHPESTVHWQEKLEDMRSRLKSALLRRDKRLRLSLHPY